MSKGFFDVDTQPTAEDIEKALQSARNTTRTITDEKELKANVEELKQIIAKRIRQGDYAHFILYTAIKCIGLSTHDPEWTAEQTAALDSLYGDLTQESLFVDGIYKAEERARHQQEDYISRLKTRTENEVKHLNSMIASLNNVVLKSNAYFDLLRQEQKAFYEKRRQETEQD